MDLTITVTASGPILDGQAPGIVADYLDAAQWAVARQGEVDIGMELRRVIRQPTPYYWTQITTERQRDDIVVHDQGVIYGPWLEGVGSRNFPVTRFKGYSHWRRVRQALDRRAGDIAGQVLPYYLDRLRGM
ncbi:hypothetical protein E1258_09550 [Micromonospora sp. KC207]|uniref:hypothetical protein n=1 Tax=Micromonospora sp. KC207 TaxID=2530377 RepID=UPI001046F0E5|nr:hypothetical protein [Micromonospora sp. KC207]TDC63880.1 hypothetical protein E1258_09550 [Micromonospora sp. KC207]